MKVRKKSRIGWRALAGGILLAASAAVSHRVILPANVIVGMAQAAEEQQDPILFYRDPMGEAVVSRVPRKDSMGMDYLPVTRSQVVPLLPKLQATVPAPSGAGVDVLFWRDPMGGAEISLAPKKDGMGMEFLPVRPAEAVQILTLLDAGKTQAKADGNEARRILYYRNPMGLPDTSPTPKKDSMGMDYVPVYEGDEDDSGAIKLTPGKIQRTGVRTETVRSEAIASKVQAPGSIQLDERRVTIVATRSTAFIEKVANVTTGDLVRKDQTLLRLYSPEIAAAVAQYAANPNFEGARTRVLNLAVPPDVLSEIERTRKAPLTIAWPSPAEAIVLERAAIDGMKAEPGQMLFRLADMTVLWALVDVSERDYGRLRLGQEVKLRARALPGRTFSGKVSLLYPQINRETRTARVRVELSNPDLALRPDMYVEAEISVGDGQKVTTVPDSAVIDSGNRQIIIIDRGEGRFEPKVVTTGRRGEGRVEIREGVQGGERVVTSANFLIDAESNLKAALKSLAPEAGK